ncbi:MAG TPA: hypothetical protein VFS20_07050 [Longimicrobium sp.]|nr:hypothetical protein [Longimicrobium sp.]
MSLLLGVNAFAGSGEGARRQGHALERWRALRGVHLANLQWGDEVFELDGFETHAVLREDSRTFTGQPGPRKPVVSEAFDRLAGIAAAKGCRWFAYANSDIEWTQAAVDAVIGGGREVYALSRVDFDPQTGEVVEMVTAGIDAFAVDVGWWSANRRRFRAYIGGEPIWDNVYTAILLSHGDGVLLNRDPLLRHERHPASDWRGSPFALYLNHLAALDRPYFTRWAVYHHELLALRARGAAEDEELALQRRVFGGRFSPGERLVQAGRALKWRWRWMRQRQRSNG